MRTREEVVMEYKKIFTGVFVNDFPLLEDFLDAKEQYLKNPTTENRIHMITTYDPIYTSTKHATLRMPNEVFWKYVDMLNEIPDNFQTE